MNIGLIGGTGPAGRALAARLASCGHEVQIGSRDPNRAVTAASELVAAHPSRHLLITGASNEQAATSELAVLATPWEAAISTATALSDALSGRVLISMVNALARIGSEFQPLLFARGSVAASLQAVLPSTEVVAAFQHLPARELGDLDANLEAEVLVCADRAESFERCQELVDSVPGLRAVYCGSLASANAVESLTAVLLNVNVRYRSHVSLRLSGWKEGRA